MSVIQTKQINSVGGVRLLMKTIIVYLGLIILLSNLYYEVSFAESNLASPDVLYHYSDEINDNILNKEPLIDLDNDATTLLPNILQEDIFSNDKRQVTTFKWGTAECVFDETTGELVIGGGTVPSDLMGDETPFRSSTKYKGLEPEKIRKVVFKEKLILNGSASHFFEANVNCFSISGLEKLDTANVSNMEGMFAQLKINESIDISSWDTSNVTSMARMFAGTGSRNSPLKLTIGTEHNPKLTNIEKMFLQTFFDEESNIGETFKQFDTSNVRNMNDLFSYAQNIKTLNLDTFCMDNVTQTRSMFDSCDIDILILPPDKPKMLTNMQLMFQGLQVQELDLTNWNTADVTQMNGLFSESKLKKAPITNFDMRSVVTAEGMFLNMENVSEFDFGHKFDTSNIEDMSNMFSGISCTELDLSFFDTSSLEEMDSMFEGSNIKFLNLEGWKNPKLKTMDSTFSGGSNQQGNIEKVNLEGFNTNTVMNMDYLFYGSNGASSVDLSLLDVSSVTSMVGMFRASNLEEGDFSSWNTSNVTDMSEMFSGDIGYNKVPVPMNIKKLDLSTLNTDSVKNVERMCANLSILEEVNLGSFFSLNTMNTQDMFLNCTGLAKLELSKGIITFPKDTNLPEVENTSKYPTSWISEQSNIFFETTEDFVNNYVYEKETDDNEILIRSFKYKVQYIVDNQIKLEDEYFYNKEVEIPIYQSNRYEIKKWTEVDHPGESYIPKEKAENIGVNKNSYNKIVQLNGQMGEREVILNNLFWIETKNSLLKTSIDVGEKEMTTVINMNPLLEFNYEPLEDEYLVSYKIETYDMSNGKKNLVSKSYETFHINEEKDFLYKLQTESLPEGASALKVEFYQLSVEGDDIENKKVIKDEPIESLFLDLTRDRSFSLLQHTDVLSWEVNTKDSKGILARKSGNDLNFLILDSLNPDKNWDINLIMDYPKELPFHFIWKNKKEETEQLINREIPLKILERNTSEKVNDFKYQKMWKNDAGLLIKSNSILKSDNYSKDITIKWVLSSNPDFS